VPNRLIITFLFWSVFLNVTLRMHLQHSVKQKVDLVGLTVYS